MSCNTPKEELPLPYRDKTPISEEYLLKNGFEKRCKSWYEYKDAINAIIDYCITTLID